MPISITRPSRSTSIRASTRRRARALPWQRPRKAGSNSSRQTGWGHGPAERSTIRQYRQHVDLHIVPRIGGINLAKLTQTRVETFRNDLLVELSRPLARKVLTSLKSLLKAAKVRPRAPRVSIGAEKRKRKLEAGRDIPTPAEIKRLIDATRG